MQREFNIGDIAHINNPRFVVGDANLQSTCDEDAKYKRFKLPYEHPFEISAYHSADEKSCGGWVYDGFVEYKGVRYFVECVGQFGFCSKAGWEKSEQLKKEIARLEGLLKEQKGK